MVLLKPWGAGVFLGPIVLAISWERLAAWTNEEPVGS
jgi:hypothetical protein